MLTIGPGRRGIVARDCVALREAGRRAQAEVLAEEGERVVPVVADGLRRGDVGGERQRAGRTCRAGARATMPGRAAGRPAAAARPSTSRRSRAVDGRRLRATGVPTSIASLRTGRVGARSRAPGRAGGRARRCRRAAGAGRARRPIAVRSRSGTAFEIESRDRRRDRGRSPRSATAALAKLCGAARRDRRRRAGGALERARRSARAGSPARRASRAPGAGRSSSGRRDLDRLVERDPAARRARSRAR